MTPSRPAHKLILEIIDPSTMCRARKLGINRDQFLTLRRSIPITSATRQFLYVNHEIDIHLGIALSDKLDFIIGVAPCFISIRPRHWIDGLPYDIHTGRELVLMLCGKKPLAMFTGGSTPRDLFSPYVQAGRFVQREYSELVRHRSQVEGASHAIRMTLYALPTEDWRIDALIELRLRPLGNWDDFTRSEGELLGYDARETEQYLAASHNEFP